VDQVRKVIPEKFTNGKMVKLPHEMPLEHVEVVMISLLQEAGVDPAVVYAFETTTLWITKANERTYTKRQLARWDEAVAEFSRKRV
jgi:hypothetical protein